MVIFEFSWFSWIGISRIDYWWNVLMWKKHASLFERKKAVKLNWWWFLLPYHVVFFGWKPGNRWKLFPVITLIPGETWGLDQIWIILQFVFMVFYVTFSRKKSTTAPTKAKKHTLRLRLDRFLYEFSMNFMDFHPIPSPNLIKTRLDFLRHTFFTELVGGLVSFNEFVWSSKLFAFKLQTADLYMQRYTLYLVKLWKWICIYS